MDSVVERFYGDGQRFLFSLPVGGGTTPPYQVILNWQAALTRSAR